MNATQPEGFRCHCATCAADPRAEAVRDLGTEAARLGYISNVLGREVGSTNDLTSAEASRVLDALREDAAPADPALWQEPGDA